MVAVIEASLCKELEFIICCTVFVDCLLCTYKTCGIDVCFLEEVNIIIFVKVFCAFAVNKIFVNDRLNELLNYFAARAVCDFDAYFCSLCYINTTVIIGETIDKSVEFVAKSLSIFVTCKSSEEILLEKKFVIY